MINSVRHYHLDIIGLYEVASVFYGGDWEKNPEAKQFTLDIMKYMKENVDKWTKDGIIGIVFTQLQVNR